MLADARGRALVWDACRVLHAAVYLPERAAPRCSVEVRCSVLSRADVAGTATRLWPRSPRRRCGGVVRNRTALSARQTPFPARA